MATPDAAKLSEQQLILLKKQKQFKLNFIKSQIQSRKDLGLPVDDEFMTGVRTEADATIKTIFGEPLAPSPPVGFMGDFLERTDTDFGVEPYKRYAPTITESVDALTGEKQITQGLPDLFSATTAALRPQAVMSSTVAEKGPYQPVKLDWKEIQGRIESKGASKEDSLSTVNGMQKAFGIIKADNPKLSDEDAFALVQTELGDLEGVVDGTTRPFLTEARKGPADPLYQSFQGNLRQGKIPDFSPAQMAYIKSSGDKKADIYVSKNIRALKNNPTIEHVRIKGFDYPTDVVEYIKTSIPGTIPIIYSKSTDDNLRNLKASSPFQIKPKQSNAKALLKVQAYDMYNNDAWFLDPVKKAEILANPDDFIKEGILTSKTSFGGAKETDLGWLLRSAFSPITVLGASAIENSLEAGSLVSDDIAYIQRERRRLREEQTPELVDYPALASMSTGRGIAGDLMQIGGMLNLDLMGTQSEQVMDYDTGKVITVTTSGNKIPNFVPLIGGRSVYATSWDAGSLLTDIVDPSYALIGAAVKAPTVYNKVAKAQKAIYGAPDRGKALKAASASAAKFIDDDWNAISIVARRAGDFATGIAPKTGKAVTSKVSKVLDEASVGDVRLYMGTDLSKSLRAREIASAPNQTANTVIKELAESGVADSQYARTLSSKLKANNGDVAGAVRDLDATGMLSTKASKTSQRIIQQNDATQKLIDETARTSWDEAKVVQAEKGTAASQKLAYEALDAAVVRQGGEGIKGLDSLPPVARAAAIQEAKNMTRYINASEIVFTETPKLGKLKGLRKVTRRLYAPEKEAGAIIETAANTVVGKALKNVGRQQIKLDKSLRIKASENIPFAEKGIKQVVTENAYDLSKLEPDELSALQSFVNSTDLSQAIKEQLIKSIDNNSLTFSDFRLLNERNIESTALSSQKGVSLETASRLPPEVTRSLIERDLVKDLFSLPGLKQVRDITKKVMSIEEAPLQSLTPVQRELVQEIQQAASAIDTRLRRDMNGYIKGGDTGVQAASKSIVGEVTPENAKAVAERLESISKMFANRLFYKNRKFEGFVNRTWGENQIKTSNILNQTGAARLDTLAKKFAGDAIDNPGDTLGLMNKYIQDARAIYTDKQYLITGVNPRIVGETADEMINATINKPAEMVTIMYTSMETNRIIGDKIVGLLENEAKYITKAETQGLELITGNPLKTQEAFVDGMDNYATSRFNPNNVDIRKDVRAAIEGFIGPNSPDQFRLLLGLPDDEFFRTLAQIDNTDTIYDAGLRATDYADLVLRRNGFNSTKMTADDVKYLMDDLFRSGNEDLSRALFGDLVYDDILKKIGAADSNIADQIDQAFGALPLEARTLNAAKGLLGVINSLRYTLILGTAQRFHGTNNVTAQGILYATTGRFVNADQLRKGAQATFNASSPGEHSFYKVATTDKAGRQYTYGEINAGLLESGVRSEFGWLKNELSNDDLLNFLRRQGLSNGAVDWMKGWANKPSSYLADFTTSEDLVFRAAVVIRELEEGKSFDDALLMGRKSLYDYNDMYALEKSMAAYFFIFYNFQRQSMTALVESMLVKGSVKPYIQTMKFKNGMERMLIKDNDGKQFNRQGLFPDYLSSKIVLDYQKGVEKDWIITSPNLPAVDAMVGLAEIGKSIIGGDPFRVPGKMLNPNVKLILAAEDPGFETKKVATNYAIALNQWYDGNPSNVASALEMVVGGTVSPRRTTEEKGGALATDGSYYVYPLDAEQAKAYDKWIYRINFTGFSRPANDYIQYFMPEGTKYQKLGPVSGFMAGTGLITPTSLPTQTQRELYNLYARKAALQEKQSSQSTDAKKAQDAKNK